MKARSNKGAWPWLGMAVLALAALWLLIDRSDAPQGADRTASPAVAPARLPAVGGAGLADGGPSSTTQRQGSAFRVWETLDESAVDALPAYKEVVEGRILVRIADSSADWLAGGELEFEVPQLGQTFPGVIERAEGDPWGNRIFVGLLREPDGSEHRFVVTLGARNQFAHLGTSRGTFELVAADGLGWLMATANMDQHVDYSRPDYGIRDPRRPR